MQRFFLSAMAWVILAASSSLADEAAAGPPSAAPSIKDRPAAEQYREAIQLEGRLELARAETLYRAILRACDPQGQWRMLRNAQQGLRRIEDLRAEFSLTEAELQRKLAQTYRGVQPRELEEWDGRGWILSRTVDGKKAHSVLAPTNLGFFDTSLMARNESAARNYRQFAQLFLDESKRLDRLRAASPVPQKQVAPVRFVFTTKCLVRQADLPPGKRVRAWFPYPLLTPATQSIRLVSVQPPGALKQAPDVEANIGIAYLEVDRPEKADLVLETKVAFDAFDTERAIDADATAPYDRQSAISTGGSRGRSSRCR